MNVVDCPECDGAGLVRKRPTNAIDLVECDTCGGRGQVPDDDQDDETFPDPAA